MKTSLNPPRGMRDFFPEDMAVRTRLFDAWRAAANRYGFVGYDACVVENLDLLKRKAGEEIVDQIYHFADKSGRELALRPEMTPTLARMVASRQGSLSLPLKWFTIAQCFRYERTTRGRKREHYQLNLDIIGETSLAAEVEVIGAAVSALLELGLQPDRFRVHFSSRALLAELLARQGIAPEHHEATFLALDKRGKLDDDAIADLLSREGLDRNTVDRVFDLLGIDTPEEALSRLDGDSKAALDLRAFMSRAAAAGLADVLCFDIAVIRGLSYYTGLVFEAFDTQRKFRAIFGGGRYDNLLGDIGGSPLTGVGLGFGDVVVGELMQELNLLEDASPPFDFAVGFMQAAQEGAATGLAARLRADGASADLALKPEKPKAFFSRTGKGGYREAVYIGPDDIGKGVVRVKNLATREERELTL